MTQEAGKSKEQELEERQAAADYARSNYVTESNRAIGARDFIAGVNWASQSREQPWVRVDSGILPKEIDMEDEDGKSTLVCYQIIVFDAEESLVYVAHWSTSFDWTGITHWRELPAPPKH